MLFSLVENRQLVPAGDSRYQEVNHRDVNTVAPKGKSVIDSLQPDCSFYAVQLELRESLAPFAQLLSVTSPYSNFNEDCCLLYTSDAADE